MRALFSKSTALGGVDYPAGAHDLPVEHASGWFFEALVKEGVIAFLNDDAKEKPTPAPVPEPAKAVEAEAEPVPSKKQK